MIVKQFSSQFRWRCGYQPNRRICSLCERIAAHYCHPYRFSPLINITRKGLDPLYGKELMGIKSDKVYVRYTQEGLKLAAESRLLAGERGRWERRLVLFVKQ